MIQRFYSLAQTWSFLLSTWYFPFEDFQSWLKNRPAVLTFLTTEQKAFDYFTVFLRFNYLSQSFLFLQIRVALPVELANFLRTQWFCP